MPIHTFTLGGLAIRSWVLLGQLPFALTVALLLFAVRRTGASWRAAILSTAAFAAGLTLGAAILPSVIGAMAGGLGLWMLAQKVLGVRRPPLAVAGLGLAATVAIGRWGCLLNGCCFGTLTHLPWGVHYGETSAAFILHQALGWVPPDASTSLAVHPYPAYESVGLLVWLPIGICLLLRLRSQGAVLAFTAAYDLALRALIDGTRAMVNVWWGLHARWLGLNLLQWTLLAAACALVGLGLVLERRAGARLQREPAPTPTPSPSTSIAGGWAVYLGVCAIAILTDAHQTQFLHGVILLALALAAPALPLPNWAPLAGRGRRGLGFALAGALLLVVGVHGGRHVHAEGDVGQHVRSPAVTSKQNKREWIYDVDERRKLLVRVADSATSPETRRARELELGLPPTPVGEASGELAASTPDSTGEFSQAARLWVGGGTSYGSGVFKTVLDSKQNSESCSNDYRIDHRRAVTGFAKAEYQAPLWDNSTLSFGTRLGYVHENFDTEFNPAAAGSPGSYSRSAYMGQLWGEAAHPNITLGFGFFGDRTALRTLSGPPLGPTSDFRILPTFHLRAGFSIVGVDMAYLDHSNPLGASRYGIYTAISRRGGRIHRVDDTLVRVFFGAMEFAGGGVVDRKLDNYIPGAVAEVFLHPRLSLGFTIAAKERTAMGGLQVRGAFGL